MLNEIKKNWNNILDYMKKEYNITEVSYRTWLMPLEAYSLEDNVLTISVDNEKIGSNLDFLISKYEIFIKTAIAEYISSNYNKDFDVNIKFVTLEELNNTKNNINNKNITTNKNSIVLDSRYTFDTFVVGPNNRFAHAAALAVSEAPGKVYNPLFIYGGAGLGKTHLMKSIAHYITNTTSLKVLYITSETFTNEVIQAIRHEKLTTTDLREKYRNIDVLLIDDIQFIIGKESTQEEFFHTFNDLYEAKKQIIISPDKPPKDMITLEDRLKSRFEWGLIADVQAPDYETKIDILKKKEELDGLNINEEILDYIASNVKSNIRELEGSLTKIVAMSRLKKKEINLLLAEEALKDIISPDSNNRVITIDFII